MNEDDGFSPVKHQEQILPLKHILPKANEIVYTSQEQIKTIYPFDLIPPIPSHNFDKQIPTVVYETRNNKPKFLAPKSTIL